MLDKIKIGALIVIIASIFFLRLESSIFKESVEIGDIISVKGRLEAGRGRINKINDKNSKENLYFLVDRIPDSEIKIEGEVTKITRDKWGVYYKINPIDYVENKNYIKSFFINNIQKETEDYSIELENFLRAIILGEGYLLDNNLKNKFRYIGASHVLVISGLHIGAVISGLALLFIKFNIKKNIRYLLVLLILTIYVLGISISPSIIRAYIMGVIYILGNIFYEKVNSKKSFIISFIISLLLFPFWIYSLSFWMSYIAVFSIIFIYNRIPKINLSRIKVINRILDILLMSIVIQLFMSPVIYIFFKNIQLFSFLTNIIIIPIISILVLASFITIFLSNFYLGFLVIPFVNILYIFLIKCVDILYKIPYLTLEL